MIEWPSYDSIKFSDYDMIDGYHTLSMIKYHSPEIELIPIVDNSKNSINDTNFDWLQSQIDQGLCNKKIVCLFVWDEDWMWPYNDALTAMLNQYKDEQVYWVTQIDQLHEYKKNLGFLVKIIELQWMILNDCLAYNQIVDKKNIIEPCNNPRYNYLCMMGRYEPHKFNLGKKLHDSTLGPHGLITVAYPDAYPPEHKVFSKKSLVSLYPKLNFRLGKTRANTKLNNVWISGNVENYLKLQREFADIPMIVNPDSGFGIFQMNDKHIWPILLGKLFLVYGRVGVMASIQRFYSVDFGRYANLDFDKILDNTQRLDALVELNRDLLKDCRDVYNKLIPELEHARWTLGPNLYKFCIDQLKKVTQGVLNDSSKTCN